ncbi:MAG: hypothetical protein HYY46_08455 [Deltaproteobacteria bacterium]|nr:hypothetical protein [Deltaproteobacteria bacterium]
MPKRKGSLPKSRALDRLKGDEAAQVLRALLEKRPALAKEVEALAESVIGDVSVEDVADAVEDAVQGLDLEDLQGRAGRKVYGYVEPTEAAWELLEEAMAPFLEDIRRRAEGGQDGAALSTCAGMVLGLYRVRDNTEENVLQYAPDFPDEMAGEAVVALRKVTLSAKTRRSSRRPSAALPSVFHDIAPE